MKTPHAAALGAAVIVLVGGLFAAAAANGVAQPQTDSQLVKPAVSNASGDFYTADQLPSVWAAVITHYPRSLPAGSAFPEQPPSFFDPDPGAKPLYQAGLVDEVVASYWECAWLKAGIAAEKDGSVSALKVADQAIADYGSLPSVSVGLNIAEYRGAIATYAKHAGITDLRQAELEMECSE